MKKRFIIRKENFGGLVYDRITFSTFVIDDFGFEVMERLGKSGVREVLNFYQNSCDFEDIKKYILSLEDNGIIKDHKLDGKVIINRSTEKSLSAPVKAYLTITDFCNIRCKHCFGDFGVGDQMSLEQINMILDQMDELGVNELSLTGGEPFIHPNIYDIIEVIAERGFVLQTCTNGTIIDDALIDLLKKYGDKFFRLSISIDGIPEVHNQIRGTGNFEKTLRNIKKLQKHDVKFGFNTVLNTLNLDTFSEFLNLMYNLGIQQGSFSPLRPSGRAKDNSLSLLNHPNTKWRRKIRNDLEAFSKKTGNNQFILGHSITPEGRMVHAENLLLDELDLKRCGAGSLIVTIRSNGDLLPCVFLADVFEKRNIPSESMFEKNFKDIWDYNEQFNMIRNLDVHSKCQSCEIYKNRGCTGGCPGISDILLDDLIEPDPYCPHSEYY